MARIWHPNVPGMIIFRLFCRILGLSGWSYGREFWALGSALVLQLAMAVFWPYKKKTNFYQAFFLQRDQMFFMEISCGA